jgi:hypothetical protein
MGVGAEKQASCVLQERRNASGGAARRSPRSRGEGFLLDSAAIDSESDERSCSVSRVLATPSSTTGSTAVCGSAG